MAGSAAGSGFRNVGTGPSFLNASPNSVADAVNRLLETDGFELLAAEVADDREQEFHALVVRRQPFLLKELAELRHVVGFYAEDVQSLKGCNVAAAGKFPPAGSSCRCA